MSVLNEYWLQIAFGLNYVLWVFSTYRSAGAILGFMHVLSDVTRLKIYEFSDPVAHETLRGMGELDKTSFLMPKMAFRLMMWSLVWVTCLNVMIVLVVFAVLNKG